MENLKIATKFSPKQAFWQRFALLLIFASAWFFFIFFENPEAIEDAKKALHSGGYWYFAAMALMLGFATGLMVIEPKSRNRMQVEITFIFIIAIMSGVVEKIIAHGSGIFSTSSTCVVYIFSRLLYVYYEESDAQKRMKGKLGQDEKTLPNGPIMRVKRNIKGPA